RCSTRAEKSRSYVAIASSRSATATPRWWMPDSSTSPMLLLAGEALRWQNVVDEAVRPSLVGRHETIAVDVLQHLRLRAPRVARDDLRHLTRRRRNLAGRDLYVRGSAPEACRPLVDHQLRVRECEALSGRAAGHDHRRRGHADAEADRPH